MIWVITNDIIILSDKSVEETQNIAWFNQAVFRSWLPAYSVGVGLGKPW